MELGNSKSQQNMLAFLMLKTSWLMSVSEHKT
jgi:hypothetical protein